MIWMRLVISLFVTVLMGVMSCSAYAQPYSETQKLIQSGSYSAAVKSGQALNTADSLSLASEALAKEVMLGEAENPKASALMARNLAEKALDMEPNHQNARLQFVVTDGFVARYTGDVTAWFKKLPQKSLELIQSYRNDFPDDPKGDALMGAWHLEIIRKSGEESAERWFGARADYGKAFFEKSLQQDPRDPIVNINYAFALIALVEEESDGENRGKAQNMRRAHTLIETALEAPPSDDLTEKMQIKAAKALSLYENAGDLKAFVDAFFEGKEL